MCVDSLDDDQTDSLLSEHDPFVISKKLVAIVEQTHDVCDTCACATMQQYGLKNND